MTVDWDFVVDCDLYLAAMWMMYLVVCVMNWRNEVESLDPIERNCLFIRLSIVRRNCSAIKLTIKPTFISRTCIFNFSNTSPCGMFGKFWRLCKFCTPMKFPNMPNGFTGNCVWWLDSKEIELKKIFKYFTTSKSEITLNVMNLYYVWDFFDNPYRYYHSYVNLH